jgi:ATP-binding cassette, subfamily B, bacterial MsbA
MGGTRRLLRLLQPHGWVLIAAFGVGIAASVADGFTFSLLIPFLRMLFGAATPFPDAPTVVERVLAFVLGPALSAARGSAALAVVFGAIAVAIAIKNLCLYGGSYLAIRVEQGVVRDLRVWLYAHAQRLPLPFFHQSHSGDLAARVVSDSEQVRVVVTGFAQALRSAVLVLVYLVVLIALAWRLAFAAAAVVVVLTVAMRPLVTAVRGRWGNVVARRGRLAAITVETATAARAVKAAAAERQELSRFREAADGLRDGIVAAERVALVPSPLTETLGAAAILGLLMLAGAGHAAGLRPEVFVAFVAVALRMLAPMKAVALFPPLLAEASAAAERVFAIVDRQPEDDDRPTSAAFPRDFATIEFRDVWVAYEPDVWVLRGLNLRVDRGEVVAIVGPSGAGKSTLLDLLPRFVEPARGVVLVDGHPLSTYARRSIRRALGIVSQETVLLHESVRANIAYGDWAGASEAEVAAAARAANADAFIRAFPEGYATIVGERGVRLSGGERQRLAIARALLRDPPILILDEATAHLDAEAERDVQEAIAHVMAGRTVFVIAHRVTTAARAHRIVVLDEGRIVEEGTHDELLAAGGRYRRLVQLQLAGTPVVPDGSVVGERL